MIIRVIRNLFLKIKRFFFYKSYGFYPEDIKRLTYVQKYLEKRDRMYKNKSYNELIKEEFEK